MYDMPNPFEIVGTGNDVSLGGRLVGKDDSVGTMDGNALLCELIELGSFEPRLRLEALGKAVPSNNAVGAGAVVDTLPEEGSIDLLASFNCVGFVEIVGTGVNTGSGGKLPEGSDSIGFASTLGW